MRKVSIIDLPFRGREEFGRLYSQPSLEVCRTRPQYCKPSDIIVLRGSARTIDDLDYLRANGGEQLLRSHLSRGGKLLAVCGGYQMLGRWLVDPAKKQGEHERIEGLRLLPHSTLFGPQMINCRTTATVLVGRGAKGIITGEEHRSGNSIALDMTGVMPLLSIEKRVAMDSEQPVETLDFEQVDGLVTTDGQIWTTYVHRICDNDAFLHSFLTV